MGSSFHIRGQTGPESVAPLHLSPAISKPWDFLRPSTKLRTDVLDTAKGYLDSLAFSVSDAQTTRQRNHRKRKRFENDQDNACVLRLKQLYVNGFTADQIWEQALRIFDSAHHEIERDYAIWAKNIRKPAATSLHNIERLSSPSQDGTGLDSESDHLSVPETAIDGMSDREQSEPRSDAEMDDSIESDMIQSDNERHEPDESIVDANYHNGTYVEDRFGLNDGFFSIDEFNKQSELSERQDSRAEFNDESDDDEIDWDADPLGTGGLKAPSQKKVESIDVDTSESDGEEDGPTFDNIGVQDDSDADEDESNTAALGGAGFFDTSDIMYADFFAPPPRKASNNRSRPLPKTQPRAVISDNDVNRVMADVRRDLFDDEVSSEGGDEDAEDRRVNSHSTHEKQRARIADEIRRLEAASVAKKEWMVAGEARAVERPINSLIEEDLDFERIGKPVPVVTPEMSESIEELIKRRIVAKEFDEVLRRRPDLSDRQSAQKTRVELEDSKPQQSLADLYEADHLQSTDSNYVDPKKKKLLKDHTEITNLWKEISSQLDTLSNWHYKPKAPQPSINVVTDVATITMEDAQPVASGVVRASVALAPQELYAPAESIRANGEVVMRNGAPVAKEEMTREQKARLRRRNKKHNQASTESTKQRSGQAAEKQQIVSDLKRGGVKLIGKEGEMTDIYGSKIASKSDRNGAPAMKL
ncbi:U3 small nucleolar ribonucleoprotein complex, subunit Mpp10 [Aspergillus karnatakaensis]|uniref:rRNA-processing protein MPP10 n=1 Tax=Aspergillus karnatakaensis TaxID=1810916 RepID=UPI003CCD6F63